jgi:restriction endonuclease S subunit
MFNLTDNKRTNWKYEKLGNLGVFKTSSIDKIIKDNQKLVHLVNYMDVYNKITFDKSCLKRLSETSVNDKQLLESNLKKGDILFTPSSETPEDIGHSAVIFEDLPNTVYSYHLVRFRPNIKFDLKFSNYFCNHSSVFKQMYVLSQGATRFTLSLPNFENIIVSYPIDLNEQQKIGSFLSAIDELITKTKEKIRNLRIFKKKILDNLYGNKLGNKAVILESLVEFERGVSYRPFHLKEKSGLNTTTLLRSNNILDGKINLEDLQFIDNTIVKDKQFLRENDIIICMANGSKKLVGKNALIKNLERKKFTFGTFMGVIRPKQLKQSKYIYYLLNSNTFKKQIQLILAGTNINNLKGSDVLKMNFSIELDEERIQTTGDVLFQIDKLIDLYEKIEQNNEVIKNHYLQKIFGN